MHALFLWQDNIFNFGAGHLYYFFNSNCLIAIADKHVIRLHVCHPAMQTGVADWGGALYCKFCLPTKMGLLCAAHVASSSFDAKMVLCTTGELDKLHSGMLSLDVFFLRYCFLSNAIRQLCLKLTVQTRVSIWEIR